MYFIIKYPGLVISMIQFKLALGIIGGLMAGFRVRHRRDYPTDISKDSLPKQITSAGARVKEKLLLAKIAQLSPEDAVVVLGAWDANVNDEFNVVEEHDKEVNDDGS